MIRSLGRLVLTLLAVGGLLSLATGIVLASQPTPEQIADEIVARVNAERVARGWEPLVVNEHLVQISQWRSEDMIAGDYFDHHPPEGHPTLKDLTERMGHDYYLRPVENIVTMDLLYGFYRGDVARKAVDSWRDSPGHWGWLISQDTEMTGVGVAFGDGYVVITQTFWSGGAFTPDDAEQYNRAD